MILRSRHSRTLLVAAVGVLLLLCLGSASAQPQPQPASSSPSIDVDLARAQLELIAAEANAQAIEADDAVTDALMRHVEMHAPTAPTATGDPSAAPGSAPADPADPAHPSRPLSESEKIEQAEAKLSSEGQSGRFEIDTDLPSSRESLLRYVNRPGSDRSSSTPTLRPGHTRTVSVEVDEDEQEAAAEAMQRDAAQDREMERELSERVDPVCPLDGTFHQLRRFGHRLWYEGDITLARVCMQKAVSLYLNPTNVASASAVSRRGGPHGAGHEVSPTDDPRFANVLLETRHMSEREFEDFGHVVEMVQRRTERLYSLPWSPVRPRLHAQMLEEGALFHSPAIRQMGELVEQRRNQVKAKVSKVVGEKMKTLQKKHAAGKAKRSTKAKAKGKGKGKARRKTKSGSKRRGKGKGKAKGKAKRKGGKRKHKGKSKNAKNRRRRGGKKAKSGKKQRRRTRGSKPGAKGKGKGKTKGKRGGKNNKRKKQNGAAGKPLQQQQVAQQLQAQPTQAGVPIGTTPPTAAAAATQPAATKAAAPAATPAAQAVVAPKV